MSAAVITLLVGATVAGLVGLARWVGRRLREWREDRADVLTAIAWRAAHLPADHPMRIRDRAGASGRVGVA